jgi:hypothetical protein
MKISAFHKANRDNVEFVKPLVHYNKVYMSKVFTESYEPDNIKSDIIIRGGSGYDLENKLPYEIEHICPDYSLYPQYDFAVGMLTRGCPRCNHTFCITPIKDGCKSVKVADLSEFWTGQRKIVLLDQNILACKDRGNLLHQLQESKAEIEFNGGIDARFVNDSIIEEIRKIKVKDYHFAWDDPNENLEPNFRLIKESGIKNPSSIGVYVLTNFWSSIEQDLHRIYTLRSMGFMPFVMIFNKQLYVDGRGRWLPGVEKKFSREQLIHFKINQHMQRWCGNRKLIKVSPNFNDYEPYKKCSYCGHLSDLYPVQAKGKLNLWDWEPNPKANAGTMDGQQWD